MGLGIMLSTFSQEKKVNVCKFLAYKLKQTSTSESRDNLQHIRSTLGFCYTHIPGLASEATI